MGNKWDIRSFSMADLRKSLGYDETWDIRLTFVDDERFVPEFFQLYRPITPEKE